MPNPSADKGRYGPTLDALPLLAWVAGPDGSLEYLNSRCREYAGLPLDELLGWDWEWVVHPADLPGSLAAWTEAVRTGTPLRVEQRLRRADSQFRWFVAQAVPVRDAAGVVVRWFGTCTDIDDVKRAEGRLRVTQSLFRALVERNEDGFALVEPDRKVRYVSPAVARLLGHIPEVVAGTVACDWVHPADREELSAWLTDLLDSPGERVGLHARFRCRDGSYSRLRVRGVNLIPDPDVRAVAVTFWEAPECQDVREQER